MPGLAEDFPNILRDLRRRVLRLDRLWREPFGPVALLDPYLGEEAEPPPLPELAALLDRFGVGFGGLERIGLSLLEHRDYVVTTADYPAILLVERLDLGLRALRLQRGLTIAETAAAAGLEPKELSDIEAMDRREKPTLAVLDRILQSLDASYEELERIVGNPFRLADKLARRLQRSRRWGEPVVLDGRVLSEITAERLDVALASLRLQAGQSRQALATASGVAVERIGGFEQSDRRLRPSEAELAALLETLGVSPDDLEQAARYPLRGLPGLAPQRKPWSAERVRTRRRRRGRAGARPSRLVASAQSLERRLSELRETVLASPSTRMASAAGGPPLLAAPTRRRSP